MSLLALPRELRWQIFHWMLPGDVLDHETIPQLYETALPHTNRQLRYETLEYYGRCKELRVETVTHGYAALNPQKEAALLKHIRHVRFIIEQPVEIVRRNDRPDFRISMGMEAIVVIKSVCEKLSQAKKISISINSLLQYARAEPVRVNLAGLIGRYCPLNAHVTLEVHRAANTIHSTEEVNDAIHNCENNIQTAIMERVVEDVSDLSMSADPASVQTQG